MRSRPKMGMNFAKVSPWRRTASALLVIGVVGSIAVLWQRHELLERRELARARIDTPPRSPSRAQSPHTASFPPEASAEADRLIADLQRPWEPMLNALQAAVKDDVVVLRVQPETDAFRLRISGQADSSEAFIAFVQRLQGDASWRTVEPVSEARQPVGAVPDGKAVSFQLAAEWRRS